MTGDNSRNGLSRRRFVTAAGAAGLAGLAGCAGGGGGGGESGSTTLEIAHWWTGGDGNAAVTALIEGFEKEHSDIAVGENPVAGGAGQNLRDKIRSRVLNNNPPSTWQAWPGKNLQPFVDGGVLKDIGSDVWGSNNMKSAYKQGPKDAASPGGSFVSVPLNIHRLNNLFYNQEVVDSAGVDPSGVSSPSDLVDMLATIDSETDAAPMAQQTKSPWSTVQLWAQVLLGEHGADTYSTFTAGDVASVESEVKDALTIVKEYSQYYNEDSGSLSWTEANQKVINGEAAFMHQGDWAAGAYRGADEFEFDTHWNQVPYPGTEGMYALNMDSFPFPANNPSPEATTQFLQYCGSKDGQKRFNPKKGSIPPRTDVSSDAFGPFLTRQMDEFANSDAQPPSIQHGLAIAPDKRSSLVSAFSTFISNYNVEKAYSQIESAL
jgi:glucose/mannose transport system substrate-binding protein